MSTFFPNTVVEHSNLCQPPHPHTVAAAANANVASLCSHPEKKKTSFINLSNLVETLLWSVGPLLQKRELFVFKGV